MPTTVKKTSSEISSIEISNPSFRESEADINIYKTIFPDVDNYNNQMTSFEKMMRLEIGIRKIELENLKSRINVDYDLLSQALSVTRATLLNKKGDDKFSKSISEKIISLIDIYSFGYEVFEDTDKFNKWMFRPNQSLGGKLPYDIIDNVFGREEVKNLIGRIAYGVYS